jgi:hypothetical protein
MEKSADILFWLIVPLLLILPFAVHAETVRCKTELRRLCDSAQVCTRTTDIQPAVQYIVELKKDMNAALITKTENGRRIASWRATRPSGASDSNLEYSTSKDKDGHFSLSDSLVTFSYRVAARIGKEVGESTEVGLCVTGAP